MSKQSFTPMKDHAPRQPAPPQFDPGHYRYPSGAENWQQPIPVLRNEMTMHPSVPQPPPPYFQSTLPTVSWLCSCPLCVNSVQDFMMALGRTDGLYSANIATSGPVYNTLLQSVVSSTDGLAISNNNGHQQDEAADVGDEGDENGAAPNATADGSGGGEATSQSNGVSANNADTNNGNTNALEPKENGMNENENVENQVNGGNHNSTSSGSGSDAPILASPDQPLEQQQAYQRPAPSYFYYSPSMYYNNPLMGQHPHGSVRMGHPQQHPPQYYPGSYYWEGNWMQVPANNGHNVNGGSPYHLQAHGQPPISGHYDLNENGNETPETDEGVDEEDGNYPQEDQIELPSGGIDVIRGEAVVNSSDMDGDDEAEDEEGRIEIVGNDQDAAQPNGEPTKNNFSDSQLSI